MTTFLSANFKDVNPDLWKTDPQQIIRAASLSAALVERFADSHDRPGAIREVFYENPDYPASASAGYEVKLTLQLVQAVAGLTDLSGGTLTTTSGEIEGRLLHADGTLGAVSAQDVVDLQGWMFDAYYERVQNRFSDDEKISAINTGDWFWVIRKGVIQVKVGETNAGVTAVGDLLVTDADATHSEGGRLRSASAMGTPNAAEIAENTQRKAVGVALAIGAAEDDFIYASVDIASYGNHIIDVTYP